MGAVPSFGDEADLLEEREIVLQMPVVRNSSVADAKDVGGNKVDAPAVARPARENAGEVTRESQVRDNAISHHKALHYRQLEIGYGSKKCLGSLDWTAGSLWAALGKGMIDKLS